MLPRLSIINWAYQYICKRDKIRTVNWKTFLCFMMAAVIIDKSIVCTNGILLNKLKQYVYASYLV